MELFTTTRAKISGDFRGMKIGKDLSLPKLGVRWENVFQDETNCDVIISIKNNIVVKVFKESGDEIK